MKIHHDLIAGVDEVGRGCLAGPVVACAVIMSDDQLKALSADDSKKLSDKKRRALSQQITNSAMAWGIGIASVAEIDDINILQASLLAMRRAVQGCFIKADRVLVDGRDDPALDMPTKTIINGDAIEPIIGCASIVAKVFRDDLMMAYAAEFPGYGLEKHKGYGTKVHLNALQHLGVTPIHRKSFRPVMQIHNHSCQMTMGEGR